MSIKELAGKVSGAVGKKVLTVQTHSPTLLIGAGFVGVTASVILACRATLKLSETLEKGEETLKKVDLENAKTSDEAEELKKVSFGVQLRVAVDVAKLYAPAVIIGVVSVGAIAGSHIILRKRNAAITAAYAIVQKSFTEYRGRVIDDQGKEKDLEYRFGLAEREIVEDGPNGPEVRTIKGLDPEAIKAAEKRSYARIFDPSNNLWSDVPMQNQHTITMVQNHARDALRMNGFLFLSDVYDMLDIPRTKASQQVGWVLKPQFDAEGNQINDGYVDFGIWEEGMAKGKEWIRGDKRSILLDFNVDGVIMDLLDEI